MILVLNCGSQSFKYKLFDDDFKVIKSRRSDISNHREYKTILLKELKTIENYKKDISIIGHRFVHGGEMKDPKKIDKTVLKEIKKYNRFAPLHNSANILGANVSRKIFPKADQIAVFDTEFFKDLPEESCNYGLPEKIAKKYNFKRLGFHGISHEYVARKGGEMIGSSFEELKIITCHLGGGSSIAAIKNGKAIDTSMGYTPLEGLMMMTRSGDIDSGILLEMCRIFSAKKVNKILNHQSGIKGICGMGDMLQVLKAIAAGDKKAELALNAFVYHIQKYIGAYFAVMGGCDLLIFTGAIGAGSEKIRNMICKNLNILKDTKILAIEADEESVIAKKAKNYD